MRTFELRPCEVETFVLEIFLPTVLAEISCFLALQPPSPRFFKVVELLPPLTDAAAAGEFKLAPCVMSPASAEQELANLIQADA